MFKDDWTPKYVFILLFQFKTHASSVQNVLDYSKVTLCKTKTCALRNQTFLMELSFKEITLFGEGANFYSSLYDDADMSPLRFYFG